MDDYLNESLSLVETKNYLTLKRIPQLAKGLKD